MAVSRPTKPISGWKAALFVCETLAAVLVPCTFFALGGHWLDRVLEITPIMTLAGFVFAMTLCFILMLRKAKEYLAMS